MNKIAVSAVNPSLDALVDPRFGRCAYFLIVDPDTLKYEAIPNTSQNAAHGAGIQAAQIVSNRGVEAVLTGNIGPNAYQAISAGGIKIFTGVSSTVKEAVARYAKGELTQTSRPTVASHFGVGSGGGRGGGRGGRGRGRQ